MAIGLIPTPVIQGEDSTQIKPLNARFPFVMIAFPVAVARLTAPPKKSDLRGSNSTRRANN